MTLRVSCHPTNAFHTVSINIDWLRIDVSTNLGNLSRKISNRFNVKPRGNFQTVLVGLKSFRHLCVGALILGGSIVASWPSQLVSGRITSTLESQVFDKGRFATLHCFSTKPWLYCCNGNWRETIRIAQHSTCQKRQSLGHKTIFWRGDCCFG